jgi:hypothetical protein
MMQAMLNQHHMYQTLISLPSHTKKANKEEAKTPSLSYCKQQRITLACH